MPHRHLRLIGYGESTPQPSRAVAEAALMRWESITS
jgi:hypothetical protein